MIQSNISIRSNIYIRRNPDIRKDRAYTEKITGAERIRNLNKENGTLERIRLTEIQEKIAKENVTCFYAKSGERDHGPIMKNGVLQWVNRCEYTNCPNFKTCGAEPIFRKPVLENDTAEKENLQKFLQFLGIEIQDHKATFRKNKNTTEIEENQKNYQQAAEQPTEKIEASNEKSIKITNSDCIISAPLDSHILLNSGPGTGKTYTILQRLIYILANHLCAADEIYILCYTQSTKNIIETKIEQAIAEETIPPSAKNICILTFDSYASYFLMEMKDRGIISENFNNYNYNQRIKLFNQYLSPEDFEGIQYFIVDEIQDLVNERATMILRILQNLKCGYLLAGDRCQSIYDYEADDDATLDSAKFYELAEQQFPIDLLQYEIITNKRQIPELAEKATEMRRILLGKDTIQKKNEDVCDIISSYAEGMTIESYIKTLRQPPTTSTAILCRTNGEAEYISSLLCKRGILHTLNRGVNHTPPLPRWIADVFWDYGQKTICQNDFIERVQFRCDSNLSPDMLWKCLCKLTNSPNPTEIDVSNLITALMLKNNIPHEFYQKAPMLTVSTIHKAKGSEFERVIFIESERKKFSSESTEEARIRYVALTRPRTQFITMTENRKYFYRMVSGRVIETGLHNLYKTKNKYCKSIVVGLTGDLNTASFVQGDFDSALTLQEYIIQHIKCYDKLSVKKSAAGFYKIYHKGNRIGTLSQKMIEEIRAGISSTDYKNNLPNQLEDLYVSGITTELLTTHHSNIPKEYQQSKICFGIQITGLARLSFEKRGF